MAPVTVRLLPDPEQHDQLAATLERLNRAANAARTRALDERVDDRAGLRAVVKQELERLKLPAAFVSPSVERVRAALRKQKFGTYQSFTFPAGSLKWPASDRVTVPTAVGRRTIRVYVDPHAGGLRAPLEGRPASLVFRNGAFELVEGAA